MKTNNQNMITEIQRLSKRNTLIYLIYLIYFCTDGNTTRITSMYKTSPPNNSKSHCNWNAKLR